MVAVIAIVEDDAPLRMALDNLIRSGGFDTRLYPDAESFLALGCDGRVDLIVSDFQMTGMTGLDFLRVLRAGNITVPVILMTASRKEDVHERALAAGAHACLQKPFDEDSLFAAITSALAGV